MNTSPATMLTSMPAAGGASALPGAAALQSGAWFQLGATAPDTQASTQALSSFAAMLALAAESPEAGGAAAAASSFATAPAVVAMDTVPATQAGVQPDQSSAAELIAGTLPPAVATPAVPPTGGEAHLSASAGPHAGQAPTAADPASALRQFEQIVTDAAAMLASLPGGERGRDQLAGSAGQGPERTRGALDKSQLARIDALPALPELPELPTTLGQVEVEGRTVDPSREPRSADEELTAGSTAVDPSQWAAGLVQPVALQPNAAATAATATPDGATAAIDNAMRAPEPSVPSGGPSAGSSPRSTSMAPAGPASPMKIDGPAADDNERPAVAASQPAPARTTAARADASMPTATVASHQLGISKAASGENDRGTFAMGRDTGLESARAEGSSVSPPPSTPLAGTHHTARESTGVATPSASRSTFEAALSARVDSSQFGPALGVQISALVRNGIAEARLHLHPAELGPIAVQIALDGAMAQVNMAADHVLTRQALEQAMPQLAGALSEAGFTLTGGGVSQQSTQAQNSFGNAPGGSADQQAARAQSMNRADGSPAPHAGERQEARSHRRSAGVVDLYA